MKNNINFLQFVLKYQISWVFSAFSPRNKSQRHRKTGKKNYKKLCFLSPHNSISTIFYFLSTPQSGENSRLNLHFHSLKIHKNRLLLLGHKHVFRRQSSLIDTRRDVIKVSIKIIIASLKKCCAHQLDYKVCSDFFFSSAQKIVKIRENFHLTYTHKYWIDFGWTYKEQSAVISPRITFFFVSHKNEGP